ncbi:hypothetical protein MHB50_09575 [Siminovitchia sp. FSL H7-0308]|uniref:Uncharacterized protein n=1 Tax=Siminovitchia thermophila TaxID=1245522 RepID=A0ABS2RAG9_9BACI|nr:hypothetical protein [Siminovitchia thermophila]MBM7716635.1 hypothetical protein [Siminovitchia thermophila]ONK24330.1 hypothetical protein BLX87_05715 [Bacillus sp. VT-16-64]
MIASVWKHYSFVIIFFILSLIMGLVMIFNWEQENTSLKTVEANVYNDLQDQSEMTMNQKNR